LQADGQGDGHAGDQQQDEHRRLEDPGLDPELVGGHEDGQAEHHPVGDAADHARLGDLDAGQAGLDHLAQQVGHDRTDPQDDQGHAQPGQEPQHLGGDVGEEIGGEQAGGDDHTGRDQEPHHPTGRPPDLAPGAAFVAGQHPGQQPGHHRPGHEGQDQPGDQDRGRRHHPIGQERHRPTPLSTSPP
jgi:hypothetical protein